MTEYTTWEPDRFYYHGHFVYDKKIKKRREDKVEIYGNIYRGAVTGRMKTDATMWAYSPPPPVNLQIPLSLVGQYIKERFLDE